MINKTKLALGIAAATLTMTGALVSPQAMAISKADRVAEAANNKVDALEAQMQAMQAELSRLKERKQTDLVLVQMPAKFRNWISG